MPRQRTVSDDDLLDAALVIVRAHGPEALTFAALAASTGLAGATIVQRFGSKAGMLHAALSRAWDQLERLTAEADAAAGGGPDGVVELLLRLTGQYDQDDYANQLLLLREDLRDPALRDRGKSWIATVSEAAERRLRSPRRDVRGLGELVVTHWQGTLTTWSFQRTSPLHTAVATSLKTLLTHLRIPPTDPVIPQREAQGQQ